MWLFFTIFELDLKKSVINSSKFIFPVGWQTFSVNFEISQRGMGVGQEIFADLNYVSSLMQTLPDGVNEQKLKHEILDTPGVLAVHCLHV